MECFFVYFPVKLGKIQLIIIPTKAMSLAQTAFERPPTNKVKVLNNKIPQKARAIFLSSGRSVLKNTSKYCKKRVKDKRLAAKKMLSSLGNWYWQKN